MVGTELHGPPPLGCPIPTLDAPPSTAVQTDPSDARAGDSDAGTVFSCLRCSDSREAKRLGGFDLSTILHCPVIVEPAARVNGAGSSLSCNVIEPTLATKGVSGIADVPWDSWQRNESRGTHVQLLFMSGTK